MSSVDWEAVRRRVDAARVAVEAAAAGSGERVRRVMQARTAALARRLPEPPREATIDVVEFVLAQERYAVEARHVREVCTLERLTPVPCAPAFVSGVVNLRGEILSVIDLKVFFELPTRGLTDLDKAIVLESAGMRFGILADAVTGISSLAPSALQLTLHTLSGVREDYLMGVTAERLIVLDGAKLLESQRIVVREDMAG